MEVLLSLILASKVIEKDVIIHSHHDGEVWGLCTIEGQGKFITSGDDNKILMFDVH